MRRLIIVIVIFLTTSLTAQAEDMQEYLQNTQTLVRESKYKEALDRFLWFHNHVLEHQPSMYGVRLSFALSYWKQLGDVYPPALTALKKTRDDKTDILVQKKGNRNLFHDVMALNRTLEEDTKTVELFRTLDKNQKDLAKQCWDIAKESIVKAKVYDIARKYIGNFVSEWSKVKEKYDRNKTMYGGKNFGQHFKSFNENSFVEGTLRLIDVAIALNDIKAAKEMQSKALAILKDFRLTEALLEKNVQKKKSTSNK